MNLTIGNTRYLGRVARFKVKFAWVHTQQFGSIHPAFWFKINDKAWLAQQEFKGTGAWPFEKVFIINTIEALMQLEQRRWTKVQKYCHHTIYVSSIFLRSIVPIKIKPDPIDSKGLLPTTVPSACPFISCRLRTKTKPNVRLFKAPLDRAYQWNILFFVFIPLPYKSNEETKHAGCRVQTVTYMGDEYKEKNATDYVNGPSIFLRFSQNPR